MTWILWFSHACLSDVQLPQSYGHGRVQALQFSGYRFLCSRPSHCLDHGGRPCQIFALGSLTVLEATRKLASQHSTRSKLGLNKKQRLLQLLFCHHVILEHRGRYAEPLTAGKDGKEESFSDALREDGAMSMVSQATYKIRLDLLGLRPHCPDHQTSD